MDWRDLTDGGYVHNHPLSITEHPLQTLHDPLPHLPIPQRWDSDCFPLPASYRARPDRVFWFGLLVRFLSSGWSGVFG